MGTIVVRAKRYKKNPNYTNVKGTIDFATRKYHNSNSSKNK